MPKEILSKSTPIILQIACYLLFGVVLILLWTGSHLSGNLGYVVLSITILLSVYISTNASILLKFKIGEIEVHEISYSYHGYLGRSKVRVDGRKFLSEGNFFFIPKMQSITFRIGDAEKHRVTVFRQGPAYWSLSYSAKFRVEVDGEELPIENIQNLRTKFFKL